MLKSIVTGTLLSIALGLTAASSIATFNAYQETKRLQDDCSIRKLQKACERVDAQNYIKHMDELRDVFYGRN